MSDDPGTQVPGRLVGNMAKKYCKYRREPRSFWSVGNHRLEKLNGKIVKSKYVIIECNGNKGGIVFSPFLRHQDLAGDHKIKSAGYCELNVHGRWIVSRISLSLQCGPGLQDDEILNRHLLSKRPSRFADQTISSQAM